MKIREEIARKFYRYTLLHEVYGKWSILVFLFGCPSMWGLIFKYILCNQCVENFWKMQNKYGATVALECTIVPLLAVTSFLLPDVSQAHWTARALWIISVVSALLSIFFACKQQRFIGNLLLEDTDKNCKRQDYKYSLCRTSKKGQCFPVPRLSMVLLLSGTKVFLDYALVTYLMGLGVYLGFVWQNKLDTGSGNVDDRNIFIVFLVCIVFCVGVYCTYLIVDPLSTPYELGQWTHWRNHYPYKRPDLFDCCGTSKGKSLQDEPPAARCADKAPNPQACCYKIGGNSSPDTLDEAKKLDSYASHPATCSKEDIQIMVGGDDMA